MLDDLLEVMDLSQLAEKTRHSELADVTIAPRFGPGEWRDFHLADLRDFHLADLYVAAGREAALEQLPALQSLAMPARTQQPIHPEGGGLE